MARNTWYRLDNVGKFYASQAGSPAQTVFRYSATLTDEIDTRLLQLALEKTADIFPSFNVCLRSGMFWHYLEPAAGAPVLTPENLPICYGLHVDTKSVLFRVSHYLCRINLEVSHIVSDGRGALSFFKTLLHLYVQDRYGIGGVPLEYDGSDHQKSEDSFDKYYEHGKAAVTHASNVYRLTGWHDRANTTFIEYHLPVDRALDLAHSYRVSLTSLVIAAIICAIRSEMPRRERHRAIRLDIPVDLRKHFKSTTTRNFFGLAFVSSVPGDDDEPIEEVAAHVHAQLKRSIQAESLAPRMNRMIALEKNPLLRLSPLFVKDMALEFASMLTARETTTTLSNLGQIALDGRLAPYIRDINVLTSTSGLNFIMCSFNNTLSIGISTVYSNPNVVKNFCRFFSDQGIEGQININKTSEEVAGGMREAKIEASLRRLGTVQRAGTARAPGGAEVRRGAPDKGPAFAGKDSDEAL